MSHKNQLFKQLLLMSYVLVSSVATQSRIHNVTKPIAISNIDSLPSAGGERNKTLISEAPGDTRVSTSNNHQRANNLQYFNLPETTHRGLLPQQISKHTYFLNFTSNSTNQAKNSSNLNSVELDVSDSWNIPSSIARNDDEYDSFRQNEGELQEDDDNIMESASSNLNQQKVVKELTKILSKGISDEVKLEILENWKRRQKERRTIKDNRAKMFEDLITSTLSAQPEKSNKRKGNKKRSKPDGVKHLSSSDLLNNPDVDQEMAVDAETVIQHLQGIASVIDSNPTSGSFGEAILSPGADDLSSGEAVDQSNEADGEGEAGEKAVKKAVASEERPIIRQFKKMKKQISTRRKQLDQIKKIFKVDPSLDTKENSSAGRAVNSKKKENDDSKEVGDFTVIEDNPTSFDQSLSNKRKGGQSGSSNKKIRELMGFLKNNPDIMASVISELSSDTDPSRLSGLEPISDYRAAFNSMTLDGLSESMNFANRKSSRNRISELDNFSLDRSQRQGRPSDPSIVDIADFKASRRRSQWRPDLEDQPPPMNYQPASSPPLVKSAEALLLESLRERQLMNLARLEMVLAERQQASNRSNIYSLPNSTHPDNYARQDQPTHLRGSSFQSNDNRTFQFHASQSNGSNNDRQNGNNNNNRPSRPQSDEEVLHHFMMVNHGGSRDSFDKHDAFTSHQNSLIGQSFLPKQRNQTQSLHRFKNWRDVSHSEFNPNRRNDNEFAPANTSYVPYDLTFGGSASAIKTQRTLPADTNGRQTFNQTNYSDSSVIRPSQHFNKSWVDSNTASSTFMTRSILQTNDLPQIDLSADTSDRDKIGQDKSDAMDDNLEEIDESVPDGKPIGRWMTDHNQGKSKPAPVDYFSSYKREMAEEPESIRRSDLPQTESSRSRRKSPPKGVDNEQEDMGAMWA